MIPGLSSSAMSMSMFANRSRIHCSSISMLMGCAIRRSLSDCDVFGGLGEIRIRERVSVFTPGHAIPARPVRPLPYASRGIRGWLRSNDLRFWRPLLYLLSYAHRWV